MSRTQRIYEPGRKDVPERPCDRPDCGEPAYYRAPKARDRLDEYHWFCLDHVREYNKAWNYYANMSQDEVEADTRRDTTWQRPTWPLGARAGGYRRHARGTTTFHDGFGYFNGDGDGDEAQRRNGHARAAGFRPSSPEAHAMDTMDLDAPLTLTGLKTRYKELVKLHHPDANGGDKLAEERLKEINEAYSTLKKALAA
ncbi:MAG: DnaJ domain-containing protein [Proteobacteria bacterium]|nr:DnaJ domain-containing protein [Pseudomonadota bacterium]